MFSLHLELSKRYTLDQKLVIETPKLGKTSFYTRIETEVRKHIRIDTSADVTYGSDVTFEWRILQLTKKSFTVIPLKLESCGPDFMQIMNYEFHAI